MSTVYLFGDEAGRASFLLGYKAILIGREVGEAVERCPRHLGQNSTQHAVLSTPVYRR
jgi:hypothetical protein